MRATLGSLAAVGLLIVVLVACGKKGSPLPPVSRGPLPPQRVSARQIGRSVVVEFELPVARGSKPGQHVARAELIRVTYSPGLDPAADADAFRRRGEVVALAESLPGSGRVSLEDLHLGELENGGIGWTLRYAVRLRDGRGRPSVLVVARDLVPIPSVSAPIGLRAEPTAEGVRLSWESPAGSAEYRFNLYRTLPGTAWPDVPVNSEPLAATEYLDREVELGQSYKYILRVALASVPPYREGESSIAAEVIAEDRFAPAAPRGLVAVQEGPAVRLFWNPNPERDIAGYRVHRQQQGEGWRSVGPAVVEEASFLDKEIQIGETIGYRITALDRADPPNESPPSDAVEIELLTEPVVPGGPG